MIYSTTQWIARGHLVGAIPVEIRKLPDGSWVAFEQVTNIFGAGSSPDSAVVDLRAALVEFRDFLRSEKALAPNLRRLLVLLERMLAEEATA